MEKILVTGAAGFIGFHTILKFLDNDFIVYGIDNLNNYYSRKLKKDRINEIKKFSRVNKKSFFFYKNDITNIKFLDKIFLKKKIKYVIHLAAQAGVRYSVSNPQSYVQSNLLGFVNILELSKKYKIKHLIYASSSSVYGINKKKIFSEKDLAAHPINLYAATKRSNEILAHSYSYLHKLPTTGLRFFTVYGPWGRPDMSYYSFVKSLYDNKKINIHNFGKHKRDFSYIDLIVDGIYEVFLKTKKNTTKKLNKLTADISSGPFEIYNLATGKPKKLMTFIKTIEKITGKKFKKNYITMQPGDIKNTFADTKKFKLNFNLSDRTSLEKGLNNFIIWYKNYYKINT
jgi:UDP-glucuronate 4-epimerase